MEERLVAVEHKTSQLGGVLQRFITHTDVSLNELHREMLEFRRRSDMDRREMNKRWGELTNKMDDMEDIIFPAVGPVVKKYFGCDPGFIGTGIQRKKGELREGFNVVATCNGYVILVEVKSTPRVQHVGEFLEKVERFKELFTEYRGKKSYP